MKKIKHREKVIKLDKGKLNRYLSKVKQKALSPLVVGGGALVAGLTLGWLVPDRFRHFGRKSVAFITASGQVIPKLAAQRHGLLKRVMKGAAVVSSLSTLAGMFGGRRRH